MARCTDIGKSKRETKVETMSEDFFVRVDV